MLALALLANELDQPGLVPAIRQFGTQLEARHRIRIEVSEAGWSAGLPPRVKLALYRVPQ